MAPGPDPPAASVSVPDDLRGTLFFSASKDCRVRELDLAKPPAPVTGPATGCAFWLSSPATHAVVGRDSGSGEGRPIWLLRLGIGEAPLRKLGLARGEVSWSPSGDRVAWCRQDRSTVVLSVASDRRKRLAGCNPRFTPSGAVLTRSEDPQRRNLLVDGSVLIYELELTGGLSPALQGLNPAVDLLGYDQRADGLLAVTVGWLAPSSRGVLLELWRGTQLEGALPLPATDDGEAGRFGEVVRFSPTGGEIAIAVPGAGSSVMLIDADSLETALPLTSERGFAWSPDAAWFALARERDIAVSGALRSDPVYLLPLSVAGIDWR